jgi:hypothetical protein
LISDNSGIILPKLNNHFSATYSNSRFFWNQYLLSPMLSNNFLSWILPTICGHVGSNILRVDGPSFEIILLSRISKEYSGARYWNRGVDAHGNTAIEAETIFLCIKEDEVRSVCFLRGSLPLMWKQDNFVDAVKEPEVELILLREEINAEIISDLESSKYNPFLKHFEMLDKYKSSSIFIIDLTKHSIKSKNLTILQSKFKKLLGTLNSRHLIERIELNNNEKDNPQKNKLLQYSRRIGFEQLTNRILFRSNRCTTSYTKEISNFIGKSKQPRLPGKSYLYSLYYV